MLNLSGTTGRQLVRWTTSRPKVAGDRLVVLGGSIAGLVAAQAASPYFRETVVVERDDYPPRPARRGGTPQAPQAHLLLKRGEVILERLLPGISQELLEAGAYRLNWPQQVFWYHFGGLKRRHDIDFTTLACTRLLLEHVVRQHVMALGDVDVHTSVTAEGFELDGQTNRVTGVRVRRGDTTEVLQADLVVDATGRGSRSPVWLRAVGCTPPADLEVNARLGYATRMYRPRPPLPEWKGLAVHPTPPGQNRLGAIITVEHGVWQVLLGGTNGDYPPTDEAGFMAFAESLTSPEIAVALRSAAPISPIRGYRNTANRKRLYAQLANPPEGFVAIGDAFCVFNPVYAQGITTGLMAVELLSNHLRSHAPARRGFAKTFHRRLERALWLPWFLASSEDSRYPGTENRVQASAPVRAFQRYVDELIRATVDSPLAYRTFIEVVHMVRSPTSLLRPDVAATTLRARRSARPGQAQVLPGSSFAEGP